MVPGLSTVLFLTTHCKQSKTGWWKHVETRLIGSGGRLGGIQKGHDVRVEHSLPTHLQQYSHSILSPLSSFFNLPPPPQPVSPPSFVSSLSVHFYI